MTIGTDELVTLRDALIRARAAGTREVRTGDGKAVKYGTDAEMAAAISDLDRRILRASAPAANSVAFSTSKGLA